MELIVSVAFIAVGAAWFGLMLFAFLSKLIMPLIKSGRQSKKAISGVEADAVILKIEYTGLFINNLSQVKLEMQVKPEKGRNFVGEINTAISHTTKQGTIVRVKYNPRNYKELSLVEIA